MPKPGPNERYSDGRFLLEIYLAGGSKILASEINEQLGYTTQNTRDRLNEIVEDTDYLELRKISGRNHYDITDEGLSHLTDELRKAIS